MNTDAAVATQGRVESVEGAQTPVRYHALDALRATMMLLGIYLHVVVGYTGDGRWPYIDPHPTHGINVTLGVIHSFRMPAFYVMAGFFGALLWDRRGVAAFVSNRTKRVLVPFVLFWSLLFPPIAVAVISLERGADQVIPFFTSGAFLKRLHPLHLWFLGTCCCSTSLLPLRSISRGICRKGPNEASDPAIAGVCNGGTPPVSALCFRGCH